MPKKTVDVFDATGSRLFSYAIALEEEGCLDAEFEEVALTFAESSGLVAAEEIVHLRARCGGEMEVEIVETPVTPARPRRQKSTVVSLIKHRMKRAGAASQRHRSRHVS